MFRREEKPVSRTGWHQINLGDALTAGMDIERLEHDFVNAYERRGRPADMALLIRHVSEGRLHCEVIVYFSPGASQLAIEAGAAPCAAPAPRGLGLLKGSGEVLSRLGDQAHRL